MGAQKVAFLNVRSPPTVRVSQPCVGRRASLTACRMSSGGRTPDSAFGGLARRISRTMMRSTCHLTHGHEKHTNGTHATPGRPLAFLAQKHRVGRACTPHALAQCPIAGALFMGLSTAAFAGRTVPRAALALGWSAGSSPRRLARCSSSTSGPPTSCARWSSRCVWLLGRWLLGSRVLGS